MTFKERLFITAQYFVPQHGLSRIIGWFAATRITWIKETFITQFAKKYGIDMSIAAEENLEAYESFNAFFTRALKPDARPIDTEKNSIVCPADGAISQIGNIENGRIFQAKGQSFTLEELLGGTEHIEPELSDGRFATVYLSPKDYHRVHMPFSGQLQKMVYVPGDLFSVNTVTADNVPHLFSRNERLACFFEHETGPFVVVLVGAMIVAGIETVWAGQVTPKPRTIEATHYQQTQEITLDKGAEMGRFKLGSTAIILFPKQCEWASKLEAGSKVVMGQSLGSWSIN